jgi:cell division protein FtsA
MEQEKIVVGLDIGTTKICAIVGRKNEFGKLEVLGMGKAESEGVVKGIVFNIDKTVFAIERAIREAGDQAGIDIGVVNVGIAKSFRGCRRSGCSMRSAPRATPEATHS